MALLQIRVDNALACQAREVARGMGLDLSSAIGLFLRQMVAENGLPFRPSCDPFYSQSNIEALKRSLAQFEAGNVVSHSLEELERRQRF